MSNRDDWTARFQQRFENREAPISVVPPLKLKPYEAPENDVRGSVLEFLQLHPQVRKVWRQNTGAGRFVYPDGSASRFLRFGFPGCPDLMGFMHDGTALFVEVKAASGGRKNPAQVAFIDNAVLSGCVAFFASSVSEAVDALRQFGYSRVA